MNFYPKLLPTGIGSLPHTDPQEAVAFVETYLKEFPFWPQLPKRAEEENMYLQFCPGLPGFQWEEGKGILDLHRAEEELLGFYEGYLEGRAREYPWHQYAQGLGTFIGKAGGWPEAVAVKGQVTGPISLGLSLKEPSGKPVLYSEVVMDVITKHLETMAKLQERHLSGLSSETIIFLDEPYMSTYGSAYFSYGRDQVIRYLTEVFSGIEGLKGIHCCGNTDWGLVLETPLDILSFDAYDYLEQFCLYAPHLGPFLEKGGYLAWGLIPRLGGETPESLASRFHEGLDGLTRRGLDGDLVLERSFLTPSCGLGGLDESQAQDAFTLLRATSRLLRQIYNLL